VTTEQVDTPTAAMRAALSILDAEHRGYATVLRALSRHLELVRTRPAATNHDLLSTILAYADSFMERFHHPKEDEYLFRALRSRTDEADAALLELQHEHARGPATLRSLRDALARSRGGTPAELGAFAGGLERYIAEQQAHMRTEAAVVLPLATRVLEPSDWETIERAFRGHTDPFFGAGPLGREGSLFSPRFGSAPPEEA
jgi:hemerythrin-like domain-containing protein